MDGKQPVAGASRTASGKPWLVGRERGPAATATLYCFTPAGGAPGEYVRWSDDLPDVQVWAVQLPGRASRRAEPPYRRMEPLVDALVEQVVFEPPFAFFGHSLGGLVAFEVARALRDRGREQPERLFLSSAVPPPVVLTGPPLHTLSDADLLSAVERRWGPLPGPVRENPALLEIVLAYYRADLELFETYDHRPGEPLDRPITAFAGTEERDTLPIEGWQAYTSAPFDPHHLPGGHFYLRAERRELLRRVAASMPGTRAPRGQQ
ncbi:thioesterase II family protein [Streptomyces sp. MMBL 11-3]|uniref:thioesterase II family protein n=1 Tax=Streptomyces sp. MMBL 11-3 TaxID=3382639 RepID=UPI0039B48E5F